MKIIILLFILCINAHASIKGMVIDEAIRQGVDPRIALAITKVESSFNPKAIGDDGTSFGLMQVQFNTAWEMGFRGSKDDLLKPKINLRLGIKYYKQKLNEFNNLYIALDAYNKGSYNVRKYHKKTKLQYSKHRYVKKIVKYLESGKADIEILGYEK